jgi:hypothetical protein
LPVTGKPGTGNLQPFPTISPVEMAEIGLVWMVGLEVQFTNGRNCANAGGEALTFHLMSQSDSLLQIFTFGQSCDRPIVFRHQCKKGTLR